MHFHYSQLHQPSPKTSPTHSIELIKMRGLIDPSKEISTKSIHSPSNFSPLQNSPTHTEKVKRNFKQETSLFPPKLVEESGDRGSQKKMEGGDEKR